MKTTTRRIAILLSAGALGVGGLAVAAAPVLAVTAPQHGPASTASLGTGWRYGGGTGNGMGPGFGAMTRNGGCRGLAITVPQGTLSDAQKATLVAIAQQEKLTHDLYVAFTDADPAGVFGNIAIAESQHAAGIRALLRRYGVTDPTSGKPSGQFSDPAVQARYDELLGRGRAGQAAALRVAQEVERTDIAALTAARSGLDAPDVTQVYERLLMASHQHLAAFTRWTTR